MTNRTRAELAVAVLAALPASACNSAARAPASSASTPAVTATCQQVSALLGDGPDPALHAAIGQLADAYQQVFASSGKSSSAEEAVSVASNKLNSICPGAAS